MHTNFDEKLQNNLHLKHYHYDLPKQLIAQHPLEQRANSRLLVLDRHHQRLEDNGFENFIDYIKPNDLLVFNDTRVIPARILGAKRSGGRIEIMLERIINTTQFLAQVRCSKAPKAGMLIDLDCGEQLVTIDREQDLFRFEYTDGSVEALMLAHASIPLPPYINRATDSQDEMRYQTVFANKLGAVAAPTAGLHFDEKLFATLTERGIEHAFITLHVGAGTFQPIRSENFSDYVLHKETIDVQQHIIDKIQACKQRSGRVIAIGTTVARSLESCYVDGRLQAFSGETQLFIKPGFKFRAVDALLTNFHLPESSLLILVSSFAGHEFTMQAYRHAVLQQYRFFSYGDATLIL